jgi:hypothetical protein
MKYEYGTEVENGPKHSPELGIWYPGTKTVLNGTYPWRFKTVRTLPELNPLRNVEQLLKNKAITVNICIEQQKSAEISKNFVQI